MHLRDYQSRCIEATRRVLSQGSRSVCVVAPTGSGKTVIGAEIAQRALSRGRVLWLTHRRELVDQTVDALHRAGVERLSVLRATDDRVDDGAEIVVAGVQTVIARDVRPDARVTILDECHHYRSEVWGAVADTYRDSYRVGLTATPERADGSPLGDLFESLVVAATYSELVRAGHLVPCDVLAPPERLRKRLAEDPVTAYERHGDGRPVVFFAATVGEAAKIAHQLDSCVMIDGTTPDDVRAQRIASFAAGQVQAISNCYVLTEGWDAPRVEVCVLGRGCSHVSTYLQIAGRVLRPAPGKTRALMIDLSGATHDHGLPTEDREYSLTGYAIQRKAAANRSLWQCPHCGYFETVRPSSGECRFCGETLPEPDAMLVARKPLARVTGWTCPECHNDHGGMPLHCALCGRASPRQRKASAESPEQQMEYLARMRQVAAQNGYKSGWAAWKFKSKYGQWPSRWA